MWISGFIVIFLKKKHLLAIAFLHKSQTQYWMQGNSSSKIFLVEVVCLEVVWSSPTLHWLAMSSIAFLPAHKTAVWNVASVSESFFFTDPVARPRDTDWKEVGGCLICIECVCVKKRCCLESHNKCRLGSNSLIYARLIISKSHWSQWGFHPSKCV